MANAKSEIRRCPRCRREITMGMDVVGVQQGVLGPRGFVPLEDMLLYCSWECAVDSRDETEPLRLPKRIP